MDVQSDPEMRGMVSIFALVHHFLRVHSAYFENTGLWLDTNCFSAIFCCNFFLTVYQGYCTFISGTYSIYNKYIRPEIISEVINWKWCAKHKRSYLKKLLHITPLRGWYTTLLGIPKVRKRNKSSFYVVQFSLVKNKC